MRADGGKKSCIEVWELLGVTMWWREELRVELGRASIAGTAWQGKGLKRPVGEDVLWQRV